MYNIDHDHDPTYSPGLFVAMLHVPSNAVPSFLSFTLQVTGISTAIKISYSLASISRVLELSDHHLPEQTRPVVYVAEEAVNAQPHVVGEGQNIQHNDECRQN